MLDDVDIALEDYLDSMLLASCIAAVYNLHCHFESRKVFASSSLMKQEEPVSMENLTTAHGIVFLR